MKMARMFMTTLAVFGIGAAASAGILDDAIFHVDFGGDSVDDTSSLGGGLSTGTVAGVISFVDVPAMTNSNGRGAVFSGSTTGGIDYGLGAGNELKIEGAMTYHTRIKFSDTTGAQVMIGRFGDTSGSTRRVNLLTTSAGDHAFGYLSSTGTDLVGHDADDVLTTGTFYDIFFRFRPAVSGVADGLVQTVVYETGDAGTAEYGPLWITSLNSQYDAIDIMFWLGSRGDYSSSPLPLMGTMDQANVWTQALSSTEMETIVAGQNAAYWAQQASDRWDAWRQARGGVMPTAAWSYFHDYDGTQAEYETYGGAGLTMANVPRLLAVPPGNSQYLNAVAAGQDILLGTWENLHKKLTVLPGDTTMGSLEEALNYASAQGSGNVIGYVLKDEPEPGEFILLDGATHQIYRDGQNNEIPIVNLLPNYGWTSSRQAAWGVDYDGYVQQYIDEVNPAMLIHTHYPTLSSGLDRPEYYSNLELFRTKALAHDIGVMGFVLVTDHFGAYRRPSASDLRWQVNSLLAYGSQGLYYYNYRIGDPDFGEGLVDDANGNPTDQYPKVSTINSNVQTIAPVLMQLRSTGIYHTGASVPADTVQYTTAVDAPIHDFVDDDFIIGVFENEDVPSSDRYVYLVNKLHSGWLDTDPSIFQTAPFTLDDAYGAVYAYDATGTEQLLSPVGTLGGRDLFEYDLEGGEAVLLRLELAPATIMDISPVSGNMLEMTVNTPAAANAYAPLSTTNLVDGVWTNVAHSTNGVDGFVVTNLGYSIPDASGTNNVIYVLADETNKFFKIIAE